MALESGARVGDYEIVGPLGTGGMSEVYQARDLTLGREVAIKVLPDILAQDPDKRARFEREAQLLAALNHPNIAVIHGLRHDGDFWYLVLELIPGETLAERIRKAPLSVSEARAVFLQIARALEAAHDKGIIHRDLKPSNVKITADGTVKLLDFGLGKELASRDTSRKTETFDGSETSPGLIMGTPGYMSPEQARGHAMAKGTDVWSFGVCLFEGLTGIHPFARETLPDTFTAVLKEDPPWGRLPANLPRSLRVLLERCLKKSAHDRIHDIADVRIQLEDIPGDEHAGSRLAVPGWLWVAGLAAALLIWIWTATGPSRSDNEVPLVVRRFVIELPATAPLALDGASALAVSPDGTRLVYTAHGANRSQLYLRRLDQLETVPIPGTGGGIAPFFSPSSDWLGFFAENKLKKIALPGGTAVALADAHTPRGGSWSSEGAIVFSPMSQGGLSVVPEQGGASSLWTEIESDTAERAHRWPQVLPDGGAALVTIWREDGFDIGIAEPKSGRAVLLIENGSYPRLAPTGHLVFARDSSLYAARFDVRSRALLSEPSLVVDDVAVDTRTGAAFFDFSSDGALFYVAAGDEQAGSASLLLIDRDAAASPLGQPRTSIQVPRFSPDGRYLLTTVLAGDRADIWSLQLDGGHLVRLTFDGSNGAAIWTPDGERVTFSSDRTGEHAIYSKPADGSDGAERLTPPGAPQYATSWSPDENTLAFTVLDPDTDFDVWVLTRNDGKTQPLMNSPYAESSAVFSPDGRFLAYVSNETGRDEVYVRTYPGPGGQWQISTESGAEPVWSRDGRELFFRSGRSGARLMGVEVTTEPRFEASKPQMLMEAPFDTAGALYADYDVAPDGRKFVMIRSEEDESATRVRVVLHWFDELERLLPTH